MEYRCVIEEDPVMVQILKNDEVVDLSGPWESLLSAQEWADTMIDALNSAICILE